MFMNIYPTQFTQTCTVKIIYCFSQWFEMELCIFCWSLSGCCCTTASVTTPRTAPVPGWVWNTYLEKLWKHPVTNGLQLPCVLHVVLQDRQDFAVKSQTSHFYHFVASVCHRGYFNCTYSPCPAVCTVYSDRHYHTFDGLEYDYHTDCQVYLLKVSGLGLLLLGNVKTK